LLLSLFAVVIVVVVDYCYADVAIVVWVFVASVVVCCDGFGICGTDVVIIYVIVVVVMCGVYVCV